MGFPLMPRAAIVDYTLTLSMPFRLTADSGLDSLCHAMEAYVSKKANPCACALPRSLAGLSIPLGPLDRSRALGVWQPASLPSAHSFPARASPHTPLLLTQRCPPHARLPSAGRRGTASA